MGIFESSKSSSKNDPTEALESNMSLPSNSGEKTSGSNKSISQSTKTVSTSRSVNSDREDTNSSSSSDSLSG